MQRELRSDLFLKSQTGQKSLEPSAQLTTHMQAPLVERYVRPEFDQFPEAFRVESEIQSLQSRQQASESKLDQIGHQFAELAKATQARFERTRDYLKSSEGSRDQRLHELHQEIVSLKSQLAEQSAIEQRVHRLLERHNTVVRNFENKLASLQKVIAQQELALLNAQAVITELRKP